MAISDLEGKYHIKLDGNGFILAHSASGRMMYEKKPAPSFVNKFGSGDSSYRDSTFWQFWAQLNWRNGAKQLRFDDGGKFWKSEGVDVTQQEKIILSKKLESAGQIVASTTAKTSVAWRSSQSWWDANYGYRKQLTITAPSSVQIPQGYPIVVTEDTAALQTAGKVLANRNDWRVIYWNGTSWVDLTRHYVSTTRTVFATQAAIAAGATSTDYYLYYGYAAASTSKQPSTDAEWNEVYVPENENSPHFLIHCKEGTGTTLTDTSSTRDGTINGSATWVSTGTKFGWAVNCNSASDMVTVTSTVDQDAFTFEMFIKLESTGQNGYLVQQRGTVSKWFAYLNSTGTIKVGLQGDTGIPELTTSSAVLNDTDWHHLAITFDGTDQVKIYKDGVIHTTLDFSGSGQTGMVRSGGSYFDYIGALNCYISNIKFTSSVLTSFPYAFSDSITVSQGSEETTQPPASQFTLYTGMSDGTIHSWDGATTWTKEFDTRRLTWYETGVDANEPVGDVGGIEYAQSQGFKLSYAMTVKEVEVYIKKNAGTPGDITVRIETDSTDKPSGTLANANATATISAADVGSAYGWVTATFTTAFELAASTQYHLVLKTAAAANDNNYMWGSDASSPSYSNGAMSESTDGGSTWTAVAGADAYFRIKSKPTIVYNSLVSSVGGTQYAWWAVGDIDNETDGDARLYKFDGTTWSLAYAFTTTTSSAVTCLAEYGNKIYAAVAPQARVYVTSDASTWTLSKQIRTPQNPGFIYAMQEYNSLLFVGGGSPELLSNEKYNGFLYYFDGVTWDSLYPFDHTVVTSLGFYDAFLFIGTYHGQVYIYDTSALDPLINFKDDYDYEVQIREFVFYDDKLYILTAPQDGSGDTNSAVWLFERHGISAIHAIPDGYSVTTLEHGIQVNNTLMVGTDNGYMFKVNTNEYQTGGWLQTSYFDANLPSINKLYNELVIQHEPLPAGCSITTYYKEKESDSWTSLGSGSTVDSTSTTLSFPSGIYTKKITFKYVLATSDTSKTPEIKETVLKYSLLPTRKWQWNFRVLIKGTTTRDKIILLDKTQDTRTASTLRGYIEGSQNGNELVTFYDIDGTAYTVLFHSLDETSWIVNNASADYNENSVAVTLIEA